jgi:hypothetical protein
VAMLHQLEISFVTILMMMKIMKVIHAMHFIHLIDDFTHIHPA